MSRRSEVAQRTLRTAVGLLRVTADDVGIVAIERVNRSVEVVGGTKANRHAEQAVRQLREYFAGKRRRFDVPLHLEGTAFQERAWAVMRKIPYGATISYAQQAKQIGKPRATRAVGTANGANPIPVIVPCHRVVASDGSLGGYALGLTMKRRLLALEGVNERPKTRRVDSRR
jgi:methylated-DNA-[protein]-cysteine S-methyltransferase